MEADFRRLEKFVTKALDSQFRESLEPTDPGFGLADLIHARWNEIERVNLYLLSNKKLSQRVSGKETGSVLGKEVVYNVWDLERIGNLIESGRERERLLIDFNELPTGPIRALLRKTRTRFTLLRYRVSIWRASTIVGERDFLSKTSVYFFRREAMSTRV